MRFWALPWGAAAVAACAAQPDAPAAADGNTAGAAGTSGADAADDPDGLVAFPDAPVSDDGPCRWQAELGPVAGPDGPDAALTCEWPIPDLPGGDGISFDRVNVVVVDDADASPVIPCAGKTVFLCMVSDAAACSGSCNGLSGGWRYDDAAQPTRIILCDSTCAALAAEPGARVWAVVDSCPPCV